MYEELKNNSQELFRLESLRAYHGKGTKMYKEFTQDIKKNKQERKVIQAEIKRQKAIKRANGYSYKRDSKATLIPNMLSSLGSNKQEIQAAVEDIEQNIATL